MTTPAYDTVNWFQIGTDDSATAQRFYSELFGWKFTLDPKDAYSLISFRGDEQPSGGMTATDPESNHANFLVVVRDVAAACAKAEAAGGKVVVPAITAPSGLVFATIADPAGNEFGVYSPPPSP
ncbi:VOC family protein [Actinomadura hibisca]|uniref:VOC family protein n=1 Tax=Actinomadura hibisca TaxID=68565 RepID=UPI000834D83E|nr:VOC family protein [Actinomadura hibisca]